MTRPLLFLVVAGLLTACGGQASGTVGRVPASPAGSPSVAGAATTPASGRSATVAEINATGMGGAFSPTTVSIHVGENVEWTNSSGNIHNVTFTTPAVHSPVMFAGERWKQTFSVAGTFHYVCTYHPGMEGEVVVT